MAVSTDSNEKIWRHFNPEEQHLLLTLSLFSNYLYSSLNGIGYFFEQIGFALSALNQLLNQFQDILKKGTGFGIFQPARSEFDFTVLSPGFQRFLLERLKKDLKFYTAVERAFIRQYEEMATEFRKMLGSDDPETRRNAFEIINFEQTNLLRVLHLLLDKGRTNIMLSSVLHHYLVREHQHEQWNHLIAQIVEKTSQEATIEPSETSIANQDSLANALMESGRLDEAVKIFRQALEQCQKLKNNGNWQLKMQACMLNSMAHCIQNYDEQLNIFQEGLALANKIDDKKLIASISFNLSETLFVCNRLEESYPLVVEALHFFRKTGDTSSQIKALQSLSTHEQLKKNYAAAEKHLLEAFSLTKLFENRTGEGLILQELASLYFLQNDFINAEAYAREALSIFIKTGEIKAQGNTYNLLSAAAFQNNQIVDGMAYAQKAIHCFDRIQDLAQMAQAFGNITLVCYELEWWGEALAELEKTLYLYEESGNDYEKNRWKILLGSIYLQLDENDNAKATCLQTAAYFESNKNEEQLSNCKALMRAIIQKTGDTDFEKQFNNVLIN